MGLCGSSDINVKEGLSTSLKYNMNGIQLDSTDIYSQNSSYRSFSIRTYNNNKIFEMEIEAFIGEREYPIFISKNSKIEINILEDENYLWSFLPNEKNVDFKGYSKYKYNDYNLGCLLLRVSSSHDYIHIDSNKYKFTSKEEGSLIFSANLDFDKPLFYDDSDYIYLIASDYVPINTLPNELLKQTQAEGETKYKAWFANNSSGNYTGTIMETAPWSNGAESSTITGNVQTNTYLKWVNSTLATTKNNPNMKAVAYMMDTSKWISFTSGINGAYAIGGPTVEMFALSYNVKHDTKIGTYGTSTADIKSTNATANGYKVKIGTSNWSNSASGLDTSSDNMWVKTAIEKASGYWLASPSSFGKGRLLFVHRQGILNSYSIDGSSWGFRPLVAIPKSSLK